MKDLAYIKKNNNTIKNHHFHVNVQNLQNEQPQLAARHINMHWQSGILHFSPQKHNIQKNKEEEEEEKPRNDISPTRPTKEARNMLTRDMVPFVLTTYQSTTN